ncbi:MAG: peptidylprolyl isomerase [Thermodesulfovibrionales bacterium]|nr:peptidylprolyl isomerase [Thermodesulfovibrionales bacterium]
MTFKKRFTTLLVTFFLLHNFFHAQAAILDKIVAIVNKEAITWSDIYRAMEFELTESHKNMSEEEKKQLFKKNEMLFLESFIDMKLQLQEAQKVGIFVSNEEIEKTIKNLKEKYSLTDEIFIETLKKEGFTIEEYKQKLQEKIAISRVIEQEVKSKIVIDEDTINSNIRQNIDLLNKEQAYNLSHIFIKKGNNQQIDEEKAKKIFDKLKAGEDFTKLAIQYSEDQTASVGGALGLVKKTDLSEEFKKQLNQMKEGDISEPFWSAKGIHILKLNSISTPENNKQLKEQIKQKLIEERFPKAYKNWLKALRERAYIKILIQEYK